MLLGRGDERASIDRMLGSAQRGAGGALILLGEPGIGKTTLLEHARARLDGMRLIRADITEAVAAQAHAGLGMVLRPLLGCVRALSSSEAAAVVAALAPSGATNRPAIDPEVLGAATVNLLSNAGYISPLAVVVDDAHLLDPPSAAVLAYAASRLAGEPVALLIAAEDRAGQGQPSYAWPGVDELRLGGLDEESARTLLLRLTACKPAAEVLEQLLDETGGNPLALRELAVLLRKTHLTGDEPLASPLPVGARTARAFLQPVKDLPTLTRTALLLAAAAGFQDQTSFTTALRLLVLDSGALREGALKPTMLPDPDPARLEQTALVPAFQAGLVSTDDGFVRFRHPLVRSAVYHSAAAPARQRAHLALARALALLPAASAADRRARHLAAAAAASPHASAGAAVEAAALQAYCQHRYTVAARGLEQAASLQFDSACKATCLQRAAAARYLVGSGERTEQLLDAALEATDDLRSRADIQHLRGRVRTWTAQPADAHRLLVAEAETVEDRRAALMLVDATVPALLAGDAAAALATVRRARQLAVPLGGTAAKAASICVSAIEVACGEAPGGARLMALPADVLLGDEVTPLGGQWIDLAAQALVWLERYETAEQVLNQVVQRARAQGMPALLPVPLAVLAEIAFRTGRWEDGRTLAAEAVEVGERVGQPAGQALGLACLARLDAVRGLEQRTRSRAVSALERAAQAGSPALRPNATAALGLLALGLGEAHEATRHLETVANMLTAHGLRDPSIVQWAPDLIEAYVRAGRAPDARRLLEEFERQAERTERTWALAATARCRGLLAGDREFEYHFMAAFRWHDRTDTPFEWARTALCLGARLRRAGRRVQARSHLRGALGVLERLGATPWAQRARAELRMTGDQPDVPSWSERKLTPKEIEVARLVTQGRTNREVASLLGVTPRTVGFHLGNIYRKLDLRSRTELASVSNRTNLASNEPKSRAC